MKTKILLIFLLISTISIAQTVDQVVKTQIYTSYFSNQTHTPLFVIYKLYKGGGTSSRKDMTFSTQVLKFSSTEQDYKGNGYDIGHMANAEDFAYNKTLEDITFRFYNALPQTPKLNRGIWKEFETKIRKQSQNDSILIICGGYNFTKKIGNCGVPAYCFKIYKDLKTKEIYFLIFPNDNSDSYKELSKQDFQKLVNYKQINDLL